MKKAFITNAGYLSINRKFFNNLINLGESTIFVRNDTYDLIGLSNNITYNEHKNIIRWKPSDYRKFKLN